MRKLEISLTEDQYQKTNRIIRNSNTDHLNEGVFGGYELRLNISIPDVFPATLDLKIGEVKELGEVDWKIIKI